MRDHSCDVCPRLLADLDRAERQHAKTLELFVTAATCVDSNDSIRLKAEAMDAENEFEQAAGELERHQRQDHSGEDVGTDGSRMRNTTRILRNGAATPHP